LASVVANIDANNADLEQKVYLLKRLKSEYGLEPHIYQEINKYLSVEDKMAMTGLARFVEQLPAALRVAVVMQIHDRTFKSHPFFADMRN
jgi:hypothetical protein